LANSGNQRPTRSEEREAARQKARQLRDQNRRKDLRSKLALQVGVVSLALVILGGVGWAIVQAQRDASEQPVVGAVPENMTFNDGIKIGIGLQAFTFDKTPTPESADPIPAIQIYIDYQCPICQAFDVPNSAMLRSWVDTGAATLELHPISFLDRASLNEYSSRATNAAVCVANYEPDAFFDYHALLMENQPAESTEGMNDQELIALAETAGVSSGEFTSCVENKSFGDWIAESTQKALTEPIPDTTIQVTGTPTILVNGKQYTWNTAEELMSPDRFAAFVQSASAE
jgi:protein-disulfide isomerase